MVFCQLSVDVIGYENSKCHWCVSIHLLSQFNSRCGGQILLSVVYLGIIII